VQIADRLISPPPARALPEGIETDARTYVIAHVGTLDAGTFPAFAARIRQAASAGADAVRIGMVRGAGVVPEHLAQTIARAHELNLHAGASLLDPAVPEAFVGAGWDFLRIPSRSASDPRAHAIALGSGLPVIASTGGRTLAEVGRLLACLREARDRLALLQAASLPEGFVPDAVARSQLLASVGGIAALAEIFAGPVGLSDHDNNPMSGAWAVAGGAWIIEKHLHPAQSQAPATLGALTPAHFARYVRAVREARTKLAQATASNRQDPYARADLAELRAAAARFVREKTVLDIEGWCRPADTTR
jgi:sialic acid synthase SpsE